MYDVVVKGDTSRLRASIEGMVTRDNAPIEGRIETLDKYAQAAGYSAYFGAEVELGFRDANDTPLVDEKEELYEDIVLEMQSRLGRPIAKGMVLRPPFRGEVLLNRMCNGTYNPDQMDGPIIEVRTTPGRPLEAVNRYWNLIGAVGRVAARYNFSAEILATHFNTTILEDTEDGIQFVNFGDTDSAGLLASIQSNLAALYSFQAEAGLDTGIAIIEAYPTKDASSAIHDERLELRHPTLGLINPWIDELAILSGLNNHIRGNIPERVRKMARPIQEACTGVTPSYFYGLLRSKKQSLRIAGSAKSIRSQPRINGSLLAGDSSSQSYLQKLHRHLNGQDEEALRRAIASLRLDDQSRIYVDRRSMKHTEANRLAKYVDGQSCTLGRIANRIEPHILGDSPQRNEQRRANIGRSSTVRKILGKAMDSLTPASESAKIKRDFLAEFVRAD